jgi:hypothetical protein
LKNSLYGLISGAKKDDIPKQLVCGQKRKAKVSKQANKPLNNLQDKKSQEN